MVRSTKKFYSRSLSVIFSSLKCRWVSALFVSSCIRALKWKSSVFYPVAGTQLDKKLICSLLPLKTFEEFQDFASKYLCIYIITSEREAFFLVYMVETSGDSEPNRLFGFVSLISRQLGESLFWNINQIMYTFLNCDLSNFQSNQQNLANMKSFQTRKFLINS